ncbi:reverse transcriptase domain-containing protein [Tanacetum coccineum]|uniref:Reverse transcriptase domain-containing protein n=1 Tax=Tanacetum coccineum TaxID=301880 RepID=A0ABQ5J5X3_9ASTR
MRSLASFLLRCGSSANLIKLALLLLLAYLCRGAMSGPSHECTILFLSLICVKTFLSLGPILVNTVAFTGLFRRVGFSPSCLSLEKALVFCEGRVSLDAVTGLANTPYYSRPIRRIQDFDESKDHCLTLKNTPYPHQRYVVYNTLVNEEEPTGLTSIRRIHQEDTAYPCLHFTDNHEGLKTYTSYPGASIRRIQGAQLSCSTKLPSKEKDPRSFTTPCQVLEKHKEAEDLVVDHLSTFENPYMEVLTEREIADKFSDEHLIVLKSKFNNDEPWYADFEEPYVFKLCADNIMRRCVAGSETLEILAHCHSGPTGGHHSANVTVKKVCEVFDVWGLDFMGPFPQSRRNKYILVVVDYVSKWVEVQALPTNDARVVVKFLRQLFARLSTAYHPQSNGQTKVTNRAIKRILERSVGYNPRDWSKKLNDALWAFRTAYKTPTGESRLMQLNELAELRDYAYENTRIYKERTKKWHNSRLYGDKDLKVGDKVLLYNSRLKVYPGKLKSKWSGPNIVKTVYPHGAIEIIDRDGVSFKVNGQRLKKYYGGNIDKEDDEVIKFENGDLAAKKSTMLVKYLQSGNLEVLES